MPTLLVFEFMPRIPVRPHELPDEINCMKAMQNAREEMEVIIAQQRLKTDLTRCVPHAVSQTFRIGDHGFMFRKKPDGKLIGPYIVSETDGKLLTLYTRERTIMASIDKVTLYNERKPPGIPVLSAEHSFPPDESDVFLRYQEELDKLLGQVDREQITEKDNSSKMEVFVAKIISQEHARAQAD